MTDAQARVIFLFEMEHRRLCHLTKSKQTFFYTEGNEKAAELAKTRADLDKASRAEWLAGEMHQERENVKHIIGYAVRFHDDGGHLNDMQSVAERPQGKSNFRIKPAATWQHDAGTQQEGSAEVCKHVGKKRRTYEGASAKVLCGYKQTWQLLSKKSTN